MKSFITSRPGVRECGTLLVESRGPGFQHISAWLSVRKEHLLPTVLVLLRKSWFCPNITENLSTGTLTLKLSQKTKSFWFIMHLRRDISHTTRKPTFCICKNKDADQLLGNHEADQSTTQIV